MFRSWVNSPRTSMLGQIRLMGLKNVVSYPPIRHNEILRRFVIRTETYKYPEPCFVLDRIALSAFIDRRLPITRATRFHLDVYRPSSFSVACHNVNSRHVACKGYGVGTPPVQLCGYIMLARATRLLISRPTRHFHTLFIFDVQRLAQQCIYASAGATC